MKYKILLILSLVGMFSCQEEDPNQDPVSFEVNIRTEGENDVILSWDAPGKGTTLKISISSSENFSESIISDEVAVSGGTLRLSGLAPMTVYFLLSQLKEKDEIIWSETKEFTSGYTSEFVTYPSTDEVIISAKLAYIASALTPESRTVIFMHEFSKSKSTWNITSIMDTLIKDGNLCVSFDFRGHGSSSFSGDVTDLIEKPWMAREDFDATLDFLRDTDLKRSEEIVLFGASIGACVATVASSYPEVIGGVAASAIESISRNMLDEPFVPQGMFYIAGELDKNTAKGIDYEIDAHSLGASTTLPAKVLVVDGAMDHGVALFESYPELIPEAIKWVRGL